MELLFFFFTLYSSNNSEKKYLFPQKHIFFLNGLKLSESIYNEEKVFLCMSWHINEYALKRFAY